MPHFEAVGATTRLFRPGLLAILLGGLAHRLAYVAAQPAADPGFSQPVLDGAYYLDWARSLAGGGEGPGGAFYLAPLYPYALAGFLKLFGEHFLLLYMLQHILSLGTAGLLALVTARRVGSAAGLATAALFALHAPLVFFASRPVGETLALFLLALGLQQVERVSSRSGAVGGLCCGLSALARPNWLPLAGLWALGELRRPQGLTRGALILGAALLAVLPVAVRNYVVSGHLVAVSSNGGLTFYHGNGPEARGTFSTAPDVSGDLLHQREEATAAARRISGHPLDAVEGDRFWGRLAWKARLADSGQTLRLVHLRLLLLVDDTEHGLDYHPRLDRDPWRPTFRLPGATEGSGEIAIVSFALLFALSAAGLILGGVGGSGGWRVWTAVALSLVSPLVFYVSSRYRLPVAALLTIPAGAGLVGLFTARRNLPRWFAAALIAAACLATSFGISFEELERSELAVAFSNRGVAHQRAGDLASAERDLRRALEFEPGFADLRANLGKVLSDAGREGEALEAYRRASGDAPESCRVTHALARALIERGQPLEAIPPLRRLLRSRPWCTAGQIDLVIALTLGGDPAAGLGAAEEALRAGADLPAGLVQDVRALAQGSAVQAP